MEDPSSLRTNKEPSIIPNVLVRLREFFRMMINGWDI